MLGKSLICALALLGAATAWADDTGKSEANFDRPGGAYVTLPADNANACAASCARDGLCLAWSFQPAKAESACALKAVVTPPRSAPGIFSGLAARAGRFASLVGVELPKPAAAPRAITVAATAPKDLRGQTEAPGLKLRPGQELLGAADEPL